MNILSIEAAASPASVAVAVNGRIDERTCEDPRAQAENLLELVDELLGQHDLTLADFDALAVGRGPGSFTGLRVAAALVQGLAYSATKPVANVSSLTAMAYLAIHQTARTERLEHPVLVCLDARKAQVYCALFSADEHGYPVRESAESVLDPAEVLERFAGRALIGVGNGFDEYPGLAALDITDTISLIPSAGAVAMVAASGSIPFDDPFHATPKYVRDNVTHGS